MLNFLIAVLAGLVCGVLSGFGIGGGSLLMVWMTAVLAMEQKAAQGINLLFFLPTAVCALIFHAKHRQICWKAVVPAALAGCASRISIFPLSQSSSSSGFFSSRTLSYVFRSAARILSLSCWKL